MSDVEDFTCVRATLTDDGLVAELVFGESFSHMPERDLLSMAVLAARVLRGEPGEVCWTVDPEYVRIWRVD